MAKMIPNSFPIESPSTGERKVFEYFKNQAPLEWIVLHSFRIPQHSFVVFGEADFVVIAPRLGIFVLEVKSGGVGFDGSKWVFINRKHERHYKSRGPFQQGREAMFEIERIVVASLGKEYSRTNITFGYGVIFTDEANFPLSAIKEDEKWRLCQNSSKVNYVEFIKKLSQNFTIELKGLGKKIPDELSIEQSKMVASSLRPIVDCVIPLKSFVSASEEDIIALTEEQYACLDDIDLNKQIVVTGGAGTGKTLLAIEEARRFKGNGIVAFICYNKLLAQYLKINLCDDHIKIFSLHKFMNKLCYPNQTITKNSEYFEVVLPKLAAKAAADKGVLFDKLIIDEFQDLCSTEYLEFFDTILKGGLIDGSFTFYGDFARQALFDINASLDNLRNYAYFARVHLAINCRNTLNIGNEMVNITGYEDRKYRLKIAGEPVEYFTYSSIDEQVMLLKKCINELRKKKFDADSIVILSANKRDKSIVQLCDKGKYIIGDYGENPEAYYALFATVQSFKGLESEIVILTDVEGYSNSQLMYVALTRARSKLIVFESHGAYNERIKLTHNT